MTFAIVTARACKGQSVGPASQRLSMLRGFTYLQSVASITPTLLVPKTSLTWNRSFHEMDNEAPAHRMYYLHLTRPFNQAYSLECLDLHVVAGPTLQENIISRLTGADLRVEVKVIGVVEGVVVAEGFMPV